jgi:putative membrane protein
VGELVNDPLLALSAVLSSLHVLALAIGLPAVFFRGRALKGTLDAAGVGRVLMADNLWGLAAVLWIGTGLLRAFGGFEKGTAFYMHSRLFHLKLGLFILVLVLEVLPMLTFMRWRIARAKGETPDTSKARTLHTINHIEMAIVGVIVFVASFMARGFGQTR